RYVGCCGLNRPDPRERLFLYDMWQIVPDPLDLFPPAISDDVDDLEETEKLVRREVARQPFAVQRERQLRFRVWRIGQIVEVPIADYSHWSFTDVERRGTPVSECRQRVGLLGPRKCAEEFKDQLVSVNSGESFGGFHPDHARELVRAR